MTAQFQYTRLACQAQAVQSIAEVFADVRFVEPASVHANPSFVPSEAHTALRANIERIRQSNQTTAGAVEVASTRTPALSLDVLMETGTGKKKINVVNYSDKSVKGFIHAANRSLTVMVAPYQSFAGDSKLINKRGVEANLFGQARSYMEAPAAIRPVLTGTAKERTGPVSYQMTGNKLATVELKAKDNLGEKTGLNYLDGHVVEAVTTRELLFTDGP